MSRVQLVTIVNGELLADAHDNESLRVLIHEAVLNTANKAIEQAAARRDEPRVVAALECP